jgi:dTDP-4-dehydrorhamnose reductase
MRLLILGASGMLGHRVWQACRGRWDTWVTVREPFAAYAPIGLFEPARTLDGVDAEAFDTVARAIDLAKPDAIVNGIGIVKQRKAAADPAASIAVNALFPHQLARFVGTSGVRIVHMGTDCVYSGHRSSSHAGGYREDENSDPVDVYGRTKQLGEIVGGGHLTLRTSMIGRELRGARGLVEWFLSQRGGRVPGYTQAFFSGLTTGALAEIIGRVLHEHRGLSGLYHVAAARISKHDLLTRLNDALGAGITIEPDPSVAIDRTLCGARFQEATGLVAPSWAEMVAQLAAEADPYERWRHAGDR